MALGCLDSLGVGSLLAHTLAFPGPPVFGAELPLPLLSTPQSSGQLLLEPGHLHPVRPTTAGAGFLVAGGSCSALRVASVGLALTLALCVLLSDSGQQQPSSVGNQSHSASDPGPIRATAPMWRCSRIMHMQRELHPTLLSSLEGIVDQMVWFRENWHEEVGGPIPQPLPPCRGSGRYQKCLQTLAVLTLGFWSAQLFTGRIAVHQVNGCFPDTSTASSH